MSYELRRVEGGVEDVHMDGICDVGMNMDTGIGIGIANGVLDLEARRGV